MPSASVAARDRAGQSDKFPRHHFTHIDASFGTHAANSGKENLIAVAHRLAAASMSAGCECRDRWAFNAEHARSAVDHRSQ